jgi:hypothetical protein
LKQLGDLAVNLSGRDIADICKDAERKWASKYIRKEVTNIVPDISVYLESAKHRLDSMQDSNLRMERGDHMMHPYGRYPPRPTAQAS